MSRENRTRVLFEKEWKRKKSGTCYNLLLRNVSIHIIFFLLTPKDSQIYLKFIRGPRLRTTNQKNGLSLCHIPMS